jgi:hypothetical protein
VHVFEETNIASQSVKVYLRLWAATGPGSELR